MRFIFTRSAFGRGLGRACPPPRKHQVEAASPIDNDFFRSPFSRTRCRRMSSDCCAPHAVHCQQTLHALARCYFCRKHGVHEDAITPAHSHNLWTDKGHAMWLKAAPSPPPHLTRHAPTLQARTRCACASVPALFVSIYQKTRAYSKLQRPPPRDVTPRSIVGGRVSLSRRRILILSIPAPVRMHALNGGQRIRHDIHHLAVRVVGDLQCAGPGQHLNRYSVGPVIRKQEGEGKPSPRPPPESAARQEGHRVRMRFISARSIGLRKRQAISYL